MRAVGSRSEPAASERPRPSRRAYGVQGRRRPRHARASPKRSRMSAATLNAWTARDQTGSTAARWPRDVPLALELIADLVRAPHFDEARSRAREAGDPVGARRSARCARRPGPRPSVRSGVRRPAARPLGARRRGDDPRASRATTARTGCDEQYRAVAADRRRERQGRSHERSGRARRSAVRRHGSTAQPRRSRRADFTGGVRNDRRESSRRTSPSAFAAPAERADDYPPRAVRRRRSAAACRRGCSRSCARSAAWLIRSIAWTQAFADTGLFAVNCRRPRRAKPNCRIAAGARDARASRVETLTERRAQARPGADRGRAADGARNAAGPRRSYGALDRNVRPDHRASTNCSRELARGRRSTTCARAGAALLDGPRARSPRSARKLALRGVSDLTTIVAEPWADWGLIDCGNGQKLERYGPVTVVRPEPQAMWAPARDDWDPDATFVPGSDEEGGGRWVQHRPVPQQWPLSRGDGPLPRLADAVPPPRLLPRHGAAMGLDARARARTPTCSTCSATPASAPCC